MNPIYYRPQTKFGARVMFLHLCAFLFTVGEGWLPGMHWEAGLAS